MLKIFKNTKLHVCMLAAAAMTLSACDAEDLGAIAIGAGIIALCTSDNVDCSSDYIYEDGDRRRHRNHDRHTRRDRRDRDRDHRDRDRRRRGQRGLNLNASSLHEVSKAPAVAMPSILELGSMDIAASDWSAAFGIKLESSAKVIDAFDQVKLGNPKFLITLGLNEKDIKRVLKLKMLKPSGIERMSSMLDEPEEKIEAMMATLMDIAKEELEIEAQ